MKEEVTSGAQRGSIREREREREGIKGTGQGGGWEYEQCLQTETLSLCQASLDTEK